MTEIHSPSSKLNHMLSDIKSFSKESLFFKDENLNSNVDVMVASKKRQVEDAQPCTPSKSTKLARVASGHNLLSSPMISTDMMKSTVSSAKKTIIPLLISIEGNIGAGKTYLLGSLRAKYGDKWTFIDEPLDLWTSLKNEDGQSLLEQFYKDQRRWSYTFQNCAVLSRYQLIEEAVQAKKIKALTSSSSSCEDNVEYQVFITERCLQTDYEVFTKMLYDDHKMDALEYELYKRWYTFLTTSANTTSLSGLVYVDTNPDLCAERINQRGRDGEGGIPLEYLRSLDYYQRNWITRCEDGCGLGVAMDGMKKYASLPVTRLRSEEVDKVGQFIDDLIKQHTMKMMHEDDMTSSVAHHDAGVALVTPAM